MTSEGRLAGKIALITGAARGVGRAHAVRFAEEGADIIAVDVCRDLDTVRYPLSTSDDLALTAKLVGELGRRVATYEADVRVLSELEAAVAHGVSELGRLDIVCANAGVIAGHGLTWQLTEQEWQDTHDVNVRGVWNTIRAVLPVLRDSGGGAVVLTGSVAAYQAELDLAHHTSAAHSLDGLMKSLAVELAQFGVRVNSVNPGRVLTPLADNDELRPLFTLSTHILPVSWLDPADVSHAAVYLASDESRHVTGTSLRVDAGATHPFKLT
ncbi:mycofactocin-coupled SDR family oxidoreductase [Amycolatopsis pithecellobii]|uniref:Mycofactocin-coupled SDR family oxidoreductase n=1 Tax=Amycolatopsis pithecellobii TaxID=664692 RepID=A0A6N7Z6L1_9PSEU|nr:mycofactocin-coupled SDR family oxidoreductase [Amycolatopsis pithecellobii]MTD56601.1 mycofactocin-coupled SDR family oxidoreductase [Amycolatopsis pithecellobii]